MLCFPREDRHFLTCSPVNFQALHKNWTNINHSSISSGTSPEAGIFVELKIAIINKKLVSLPPHFTLRASLETAQCCRETWLQKAKLIRSRSFVLNQGWRGGQGKAGDSYRILLGPHRETSEPVLHPAPAAVPLQSTRWVPQCSNPRCQASCPAAPCSAVISKQKDASITMQTRSHQVLLTLNGWEVETEIFSLLIHSLS